MGGLDRGDRDDAGFQAELVGRLPAHQGDHPERAGLHLDLGHHAVLDDARDDSAHPVARGGRGGGARLRRLGQLLGERGELGPLDGHPPALLYGGQASLVDPAPQGVIADSEQRCRITDPQIRHERHLNAASAHPVGHFT